MEIREFLELLSQHGLVRLGKITGDWYTIHCPFHKDGQERKPSCGVLLKDIYRGGRRWKAGTYHCFTCGTVKSFQEGVRYILYTYCKDNEIRQELMSKLDDDLELDDDALLPSDMVDALSAKFAVESIQRMQQPEQTFISEEELASYRYTVPYMYERKLTDEIIEMFDIGVDMHWIPPGRKKELPCITFPVRDAQGRTLFIYRRSIEGKFFNAPEGVEKPLFGIDVVPKDCTSLLICESILNACTAWVYGYPAVALLGTGNSLQLQQLRELGIHEFTICMDGDEAGRKATKKLQRALSKNAVIWTIHMPDGKDLNDCTAEEFYQLYSERE